MTYWAGVVLMALSLQTGGQRESDVQVRATVAPDSVLIGQRLTLRVTVSGLGADGAVELPALADSGVITALSPPLVLGDRDDGVWSARYELAAWDLGVLALPGGSVRVVTDSGEMLIPLPEMTVTVVSVLPEEADLDTLPWQPPADVVGGNWSLAEKLAGALVALALLTAAVFYLRRRGASQPLPVPSGKDPRERALEALDSLAGSGLAEGGEMKAFYSALSQIIREFIAGSRAEWGLDLTTSELRAALAEYGVAGTDVQVAGELLETSDSVKFARTRPKVSYALDDLQVARRWIADFESPILVPETAEVERGVAEGEDAGEYEVTALEDLFAGVDGRAGDDTEREAEIP